VALEADLFEQAISSSSMCRPPPPWREKRAQTSSIGGSSLKWKRRLKMRHYKKTIPKSLDPLVLQSNELQSDNERKGGGVGGKVGRR
jgi:hypothetical protein